MWNWVKTMIFLSGSSVNHSSILRLHRRRFRGWKNRAVEIDSFEVLFGIFASAWRSSPAAFDIHLQFF